MRPWPGKGSFLEGVVPVPDYFSVEYDGGGERVVLRARITSCAPDCGSKGLICINGQAFHAVVAPLREELSQVKTFG